MNLIKQISIAILLAITVSYPAFSGTIPAAIYSRYTSLANNYEKKPASVDVHNAICDFYRQQLKKNDERQILAGNLYLQVLLQLEDYVAASDVNQNLLSLDIDTQQRLAFRQLGGQLSISILQQGGLTRPEINAGWEDAITHLTAWFKILDGLSVEEKTKLAISNSNKATNGAMLAQSYYHVGKLEESLPWAKRAYNLDAKKESYTTLLLALYERMQMYSELNQQLAKAVVAFPKTEDYWERWAYSYLRLEEPELALSTLSISRNQGRLTSQGYKVLASLYLSMQQPRLAANTYLEAQTQPNFVADKQYYKNLSDAWLMARDREKALEVYVHAEKAGIEVAKSHQRQAQLLYIEGHWSEAESAYLRLLNNLTPHHGQDLPNHTETANVVAGSDNHEQWRFMLAMAQVQQEKNQLAKRNLEKLSSEKYQRVAKTWLAQIDG